MNNEFIRLGIEEDRWLKAERLRDRFVTELRGELQQIGNDIVTANSSLFPDDASPNWNYSPDAGNVIAFARVQYPMNPRADSHPDANTLLFNFGLRWADPAEYGLSKEGAVCLPRYKIKNLTDEDFQAIATETEAADSDVRSGPDPHRNAPGSYYVPVTDPGEIGDALRLLQSHFGQYGERFGVLPSDSP